MRCVFLVGQRCVEVCGWWTQACVDTLHHQRCLLEGEDHSPSPGAWSSAKCMQPRCRSTEQKQALEEGVAQVSGSELQRASSSAAVASGVSLVWDSGPDWVP